MRNFVYLATVFDRNGKTTEVEAFASEAEATKYIDSFKEAPTEPEKYVYRQITILPIWQSAEELAQVKAAEAAEEEEFV